VALESRSAVVSNIYMEGTCLRLGMGVLRRLSADSPLEVSDFANVEVRTNMQSTITTSTSKRRYGHSRLSIPGCLAGLPLRSCSGWRNASCSSLVASIFTHQTHSLTHSPFDARGVWVKWLTGKNEKGFRHRLDLVSAFHAVCKRLHRW
jgi:hypothetical protein